MTTPETLFKELLVKLSMEPYATPVTTDDTLVVLARMSARTAPEMKRVESRLLYCIEKMLQLTAEGEKSYAMRLSRPFILKENTLRYTWDFTIKGDVAAAVADVQQIKIPEINFVREEVVNTQSVKPSRGSVRPVTVGNSRK